MKKLKYINSKNPNRILNCPNTNITVQSGDIYKYYFSSSGADSWLGFLMSQYNEPYLKIRMKKNNTDICSFEFDYASTAGDGGNSLSTFNYGDVFSATLRINDDLTGTLSIFNETRNQFITPPLETSPYLAEGYDEFDGNQLIINMPTEGLFYKFEYIRDNQILMQLIPAITDNCAYLYDNMSGIKYKMLEWDKETHSVYDFFNLGPEIYCNKLSITFNEAPWGGTHTIDISPIDIYGNVGPSVTAIADP